MHEVYLDLPLSSAQKSTYEVHLPLSYTRQFLRKASRYHPIDATKALDNIVQLPVLLIGKL